MAVLYLPAMNRLFDTVPRSASVMAMLVLLASAVLWAEELRKAHARGCAEA